MNIKVLEQTFCVCKVENFSLVDFEKQLCFISNTDEEKSLVCVSDCVPQNITQKSDGWRGLRIEGVLDFSMVGILAKIATTLAENQISIFAVSTFNTDYIFVKEQNFQKACQLISRL